MTGERHDKGMMDVRGKTCRMQGDIRNTYKILVGKLWRVLFGRLA
jgi:hypothetical protein